MGGRGSGGGRSGGGGSASSDLQKQALNISKSVVTMKEFSNVYHFYNNMNDSDLLKTEKFMTKKADDEVMKYDKMLAELDNTERNLPKNKNNKFMYDTSTKEWKDFKNKEKAVEKQLGVAQGYSQSLKQARKILEKRNLKPLD